MKSIVLAVIAGLIVLIGVTAFLVWLNSSKYLKRNQPNSTRPLVFDSNGSDAQTSPQITAEDKIDTKAFYEIYTNGTKRTFTDPMYHNQSPDVFIDASDPTVVHVTRKGITWSDFFATLPMTITADCIITGTGQEFCTNQGESLRFYINDTEYADALFQEILDGDKLRVVYD